MKVAEQAFDAYNLRARILPAVILILPLWLGIVAWFPLDAKILGGAVAIFGALALAYIASDWVRRRGKAIQDSLFEHWGGVPSVRMLSFAHSSINRDTLRLCHDKCRQLVPNRTFPDSLASETANMDESYKTYHMCSDVLAERTRDARTFPVLFEENVRYGMRRNFLGIRRIGILTSLTGVVIAGSRLVYRWQSIGEGDGVAVTSVLLSIGILAFWTLLVTEEWVRQQAEEYAKRLILGTQAMDPPPR